MTTPETTPPPAGRSPRVDTGRRLGRGRRRWTDGEHGGVSPLLIVGGIAVVVLAAALLALRGGSSGSSNLATGGDSVDTVAPASAGPCGEGTPDSSYSLIADSDPSPPRPPSTTVHLNVQHDGKAVTGAKVCVAVDMPTMVHAGISQTAKETSRGRYDVDLKFSMEGSWAGTITILQPGQPTVSIPLTLDVAPS